MIKANRSKLQTKIILEFILNLLISQMICNYDPKDVNNLISFS